MLVGGCNDHVFREVKNVCSPTSTPKEEQAVDIPADILLIVDNSGSMCEEQENLVRNFYREECPITDLANVPVEYKNPTPETVAVLSQNCGFIQILATYDNDFRIGVISTDATLCDNRLDTANLTDQTSPYFCGLNAEPWGRRPQRGCLQAAPGAEKKYIQNGDENIQEVFASMISRVQTHGSPFERGLDAMRILLDDQADKHPDCQSDGADFLRPDARLVVIIISDEDDCSHSDGATGFIDENASETTCEEAQPPWQSVAPYAYPSSCYDASEREKLTQVSEYVDFLNQLKGPDKVSVAVIAGSTFAEGGELVSAGCKVGDDQSATPGAPDGACRESQGQSNFKQNVGNICHPDQEGGPCCAADPGTRYFAFADAMDNALKDSICQESFGPTMINIAQFIAAKAQFRLDEGTLTDQLNIYVCNKGVLSVEDCAFSSRIPYGEDPVGRNGWQLSSDNKTVSLFGSSVLQPGQEVRIFALREDDRSCADWADPPSNATPDAGATTAQDAGATTAQDAGATAQDAGAQDAGASVQDAGL